jgi:hypothetical protein
MGRSKRFWDDMYGSGMPVWKVCAERPEGGRVLFEGASVEVAVRRGQIFLAAQFKIRLDLRDEGDHTM